MKKIFYIILIICLCGLFQFQTESSIQKLLIGSYTSSSKSDGIYVYAFNSKTGDAELISKVSGEENPSYLTVSRDRKYVYAVNEVREGKISSFLLNSTTGELTFLNRVSSGGVSPCYVSVDDNNKYVFVGNYGNGTLSAIPLKADGSLGDNIQTIQEEGRSINERRQTGPHVHCTVLSPDNKFLLTSNLGTDRLSIYRFEAGKYSDPLTPGEPPYISVKAGSGPRHLTFHPSSKFVYLITELTGMIIAFDYKNGKLIEKQEITMLSPDFEGSVGGADIHISPDGNFLYGSNRGDANELVIFSINKSGELNYVGRQSTFGKGPRNFVIDPTGNFLLVANQNSNEVIIFNRNRKTGLLTPSGKSIHLNSPVCLKFLN
ncbi:MAG TPA: lactonase family protein [Bacteroidales bacterium]|nr:lactonase family protein [Bacteroidales bacterium]HCI54527.1 3-carboxymuconate cyclase [Bacteroidales bacterium]HOU96841.1 lactonase family protein [Bacteroidales bacterium]HQG37234.1 lactonase family protein [Bacteroidales bacterium]HRC90378.1 lactonase family protein [Bacteroidales bacterium]